MALTTHSTNEKIQVFATAYELTTKGIRTTDYTDITDRKNSDLKISFTGLLGLLRAQHSLPF